MEQASSIQIDGFGPIPLVRPADAAAVGEEVRRAAGQNLAIYPAGGRTRLDHGTNPSRPGVAIDTTALAGVVDYPARDMTITVQAGIRIGQLQAILARENQRLAVDIPCAEEATLGGALAVNSSGPHRFGCGTLRDYLLGISFVNDLGHEIKAGGRVVKNVAGYDQCKLMIGSLGTLGIITQATLKLRPVPESQAILICEFPVAELEKVLSGIHGTRTRPVAIEVLNSAAARNVGIASEANRWVALVGFEENRDAVAWQVQTAQAELSKQSVSQREPVIGDACAPIWRGLTELPFARNVRFGFQACVPAHAVPELCQEIARANADWAVRAHAGNGIVHFMGNEQLTREHALKTLLDAREFAARSSGFAFVTRCPSEWKSGFPIWGRPREDLWLMQRIKEELDPKNLFNPGRFVVGA